MGFGGVCYLQKPGNPTALNLLRMYSALKTQLEREVVLVFGASEAINHMSAIRFSQGVTRAEGMRL